MTTRLAANRGGAMQTLFFVALGCQLTPSPSLSLNDEVEDLPCTRARSYKV